MRITDFSIRDGYKASFTATLDRGEFLPFLKRASEEAQRRAPLDGYPEGGAPLELAERRYGHAL